MSDLYPTTTETPNLDALLADRILSERGRFPFAEELPTTVEPPGTDDAVRRALTYNCAAQSFGEVDANVKPMETNANPQHHRRRPVTTVWTVEQTSVEAHPWCSEDWAVRLGRVQELEDYLNGICDQGFISADVKDDTLKAWRALSASTHNALMVPNACPGDEGDLLLTWDRDDHHLELEFVQGSPAIVFFTDRTRGMPWESEFHADASLEPRLFSALALFASPAR
jgi:hypothetical protein